MKAKPEHLAGINRFTKEPLTAEEAYVHKFRMIGTRFMPSRCLQIHESMLPIYKAFVDNGDVVHIADHTFGRGSFFSSSDIVTVPFGRYFSGEIVTDEKGDKQLDALMYMKAGQKTYLNGFTTDDINDQMDAGIIHDSSVSISWGKSECSVCGNDIRDYENCPHWPGQTYKVQGIDQLCYIIAKPAEQSDHSVMIENSSVCAGAYPDAGNLPLSMLSEGQEPPKDKGYQKLNNMADLKLVNKDSPVFCLLSSNDATVLVTPESKLSATDLHELYHQMYQGLSENGLPNGWSMAKLVASHTEAVKEITTLEQSHELKDALDGTLPATLKKLSKEPEKGSGNMELQQIVRTALGLGIDAEITPEAITKALSAAKLSVEASVRTALGIEPEAVLSESLANVAKDAEQGRQFRADVIETALVSGVRDQGNDFQADTFKKMFDALSIDEIKAMGEGWEKSAVAKLGIVRHSDDGTPEPEKGEALAMDDECYSMKK